MLGGRSSRCRDRLRRRRQNEMLFLGRNWVATWTVPGRPRAFPGADAGDHRHRWYQNTGRIARNSSPHPVLSRRRTGRHGSGRRHGARADHGRPNLFCPGPSVWRSAVSRLIRRHIRSSVLSTRGSSYGSCKRGRLGLFKENVQPGERVANHAQHRSGDVVTPSNGVVHLVGASQPEFPHRRGRTVLVIEH